MTMTRTATTITITDNYSFILAHNCYTNFHSSNYNVPEREEERYCVCMCTCWCTCVSVRMCVCVYIFHSAINRSQAGGMMRMGKSQRNWRWQKCQSYHSRSVCGATVISTLTLRLTWLTVQDFETVCTNLLTPGDTGFLAKSRNICFSLELNFMTFHTS